MATQGVNITSQQEDFLYDIVYCSLEPFESFKKNYSTKGLKPAHIRARVAKLLETPAVANKYQSMLNDRAGQSIVDENYVIRELKQLIANAKSESARVRALELLGKYKNMFKEHYVLEDSKHTEWAEKVRENRQRIRNGEEPKNLAILEFEKDESKSSEQGEYGNGTD